uniref:Neurogenic mastermind-like N-terminal domain-containing protein n=1 Tax=Mola mola TaxID=94237 RepID=A0A3Q3W9K1_MOLML
MGDFASPAAGPNGSMCMNPGAGSVVPGGAVGITKHSTVVERLRQRIEGCRRHHVNCESRYQQAHAEQLEIERRETVSLHQRSLEQRAKKSAGGSSKQPQSKQPEADSASSTEQRSNTLIAVRTSSRAAPPLTHFVTHKEHVLLTRQSRGTELPGLPFTPPLLWASSSFPQKTPTSRMSARLSPLWLQRAQFLPF